MRVYFIGAGPGAADLITVRGASILSKTNLILYAGSLVPSAVLSYCQPDAEIVNTAELDLDSQFVYFEKASSENRDVARVHSGDPAIYGAIAEQMKRLDEIGIAYEIVPGVSSFTAAAASLGTELTKPGVSQSIILTRVSGRASAVPETESIETLAQHLATMCIFLSGPHLKKIVADLKKHYPGATPIALVAKASQEDEKQQRSTLDRILDEVDINDWKLTTMLLVGEVLDRESGSNSKLYSDHYTHKFRLAGAKNL
jgi:precorrin-4/cobalt-precorrin-4 C11-methyltransferase